MRICASRYVYKIHIFVQYSGYANCIRFLKENTSTIRELSQTLQIVTKMTLYIYIYVSINKYSEDTMLSDTEFHTQFKKPQSL